MNGSILYYNGARRYSDETGLFLKYFS